MREMFILDYQDSISSLFLPTGIKHWQFIDLVKIYKIIFLKPVSETV